MVKICVVLVSSYLELDGMCLFWQGGHSHGVCGKGTHSLAELLGGKDLGHPGKAVTWLARLALRRYRL